MSFLDNHQHLLVNHLHFHGHFPGEPGPAGVPAWSSSFTGSWREPLGTSVTGFYRPDVLPVTQPTVSKHWGKLKALTWTTDNRPPGLIRSSSITGLPALLLLTSSVPSIVSIVSVHYNCDTCTIQHHNSLIYTKVMWLTFCIYCNCDNCHVSYCVPTLCNCSHTVSYSMYTAHISPLSHSHKPTLSPSPSQLIHILTGQKHFIIWF